MAEDENMSASARLTNDDFRKLLMTPRSSVPSATPASVPGTVRDSGAKAAQTPVVGGSNRAELRRKKKSYYAKLKKQEDDKMAELAEKYRDRARERRDGTNQEQVEDPMTNASAYRAVAPDLKSGYDAAERRRQMIQQSKFLGGDMEHTHLVKGLDYALLQKVRSEIEARETEQEIEMEKLAKPKEKVKEKVKEVEKKDEEVNFKSKTARNICKTIMIMKSKTVERNELFAPGRMAYVIELDDETEVDIPTTLIRSKADVPTIDNTPTLTTNDIVINKLAQILSYLRQGNRHGKKNKKNKDGRPRLDDFNELEIAPQRSIQDDSIYGDIGDYIPDLTKSESSHLKNKKKESYFAKPEPEINEEDNAPRLPNAEIPNEVAAIAKAIASSDVALRRGVALDKPAVEPVGYAECYPGLDEMQDAIDDSDDEVDYTKMDLGNKKGPIGRWDFDTQEEYSEYMNNKEALPKAAFQYGVKMADGRRTRKYNKEKNEKAELDREWQKIQNIMNKRKSTNNEGAPELKASRY
ncbi:protein Red [Copidosoma floridanum]|uniref:protein Red n=1 Tax=Copidosoma floridanum TaxID=29053 RepID=UPI0006C9D350|nr:protein Red [Copidosoma floridanum]XP_014205640.1 protein Red [Copidosoma floridanum]